MSKSLDSWSQTNSNNIEEFLKGDSQSFLEKTYSLKASVKDYSSSKINTEISRDNPLDMDSNAESKRLELEDLEVKRSDLESLKDYEEQKLEIKSNDRGTQSRN